MGLTLLGTLLGSGWTMWCYISRVEHLHQQQRRQLQLRPPLRAGLLPHQGCVRVRRLVRKESWLESTYGVVHGRDCDVAGEVVVQPKAGVTYTAKAWYRHPRRKRRWRRTGFSAESVGS